MIISESLMSLINRNGLSQKTSKFGTDKSFPHSYIQNLYEEIFVSFPTISSILEIGVWKGASCALWKLKSPRALVVGVDIHIGEMHPIAAKFRDDGKIEIHENDAYSDEFMMNEKRDFDLIIDDGPHTIESQIKALKFRRKLSPRGLLVIEDVQDGAIDFWKLRRSLPKEERDLCCWISFSNTSYRFDDAVFIYSPSIEAIGKLRSIGQSFSFWGVRHPFLHYPYRAWTRLQVFLSNREYC